MSRQIASHGEPNDPRRDRGGHPGPANAPERRAEDPGPPLVLVVEDDDNTRGGILQLLRLGGYSVLEAGSAHEALSVAGKAEGHISLLLTDVVLPDLSGPWLADRLRTTDPDTKVLFVSGYSRGSVGYRLEPDAVMLEKPFSPH